LVRWVDDRQVYGLQDGRMDKTGIAVQQECTLVLVLAVFLLQVTLRCHLLVAQRLRPTVNTAANVLRSRVQ
jgi:hypothetical protein